MHNARIWTEFFEIAGHPVVETRAHRQQHVAGVHAHVRFIGAVHAKHADKQRISRRIGAKTHERIGAGVTEQTHQLSERL